MNDCKVLNEITDEEMKSVWTEFRDCCSGGCTNTIYGEIHIQLPEEDAIKYFNWKFDVDAENDINCHCCGNNWSISEYESLLDALQYEFLIEYETSEWRNKAQYEQVMETFGWRYAIAIEDAYKLLKAKIMCADNWILETKGFLGRNLILLIPAKNIEPREIWDH